MKNLTMCVLLLFFASGLHAQESKEKPGDAPGSKGRAERNSLKHWNGTPFVLVANGSGGEKETSDNLKAVLRAQHLPALVIPILWCRQANAVRDHLDQEAQFVGAACAVEWAKRIRTECPDSPIFLVGHSAGSHVVLRAAEQLGEGSVERLYLLAPSVSSHYDLTRALKSCRSGICSFWSQNDTALEIAADYWGTADGMKTACAGRVGFRVSRETAAKHPELYGKFTQTRWQEGMGGVGGHMSWTRESFMCRYLVPSLFVLSKD